MSLSDAKVLAQPARLEPHWGFHSARVPTPWIHTQGQGHFHLIPMHPWLSTSSAISMETYWAMPQRWGHPVASMFHSKQSPETESRRRSLNIRYNGSLYRLGSALPAKQKVAHSRPAVYSAVRTGPRQRINDVHGSSFFVAVRLGWRTGGVWWFSSLVS